VLLRVGALVGLFLLLAPIHFIAKALLGRSSWPSRFLAIAAGIVGARVRRTGAPVAPHTLLICNHVSWLDILVLAGATRCRLVSKDQLGHPFIHWLADQNSTVYVKRSHVKGAKDQALTIARALEGEQPVALDYGSAAAEIGWWHEPGKSNVLRVLGRRGTLPVTVNVLESLDRSGGRKDLTAAARGAIEQRLRLTSPGQSPIGEDK
jgi:1-acyl-sn-glycerol-3-phosphate acyltransferase